MQKSEKEHEEEREENPKEGGKKRCQAERL